MLEFMGGTGVKKTCKESRILITGAAEQVSILYWNWKLWFHHYDFTTDIWGFTVKLALGLQPEAHLYLQLNSYQLLYK